MNAHDDLVPIVQGWLRGSPGLQAADRERITDRVRREVHGTRQRSRLRTDITVIATKAVADTGRIGVRRAPALPIRSSSAWFVAVAAAVAVLAAGAIMLRPARLDPTLPGIAAIPSAALASSPVATPTPGTSPALNIAWTTVPYPDSPYRQSVESVWSDGVVSLVSASPKQGRHTIWVSEDAGSSWRVASLVDGQGRSIDQVGGGAFQFTKAGQTYYAIGREQGSLPVGFDVNHVAVNQRIMRSDDGVHWQQVASNARLPEHVGWVEMAAAGLVASGSVLTPDGGVAHLWNGIDLPTGRSDPAVLTSADGVTWTVSTMPPTPPGEQATLSSAPLIGPDGSMLIPGYRVRPVVPGPNDVHDMMWRSADGAMSEGVTSGPVSPEMTDHEVYRRTGSYAGGFFVMTYDDATRPARATLWTSPDGEHWEAHPAPEGTGWATVFAFDGGVMALTSPAGNGTAGWLFTAAGEWQVVGGDALTVGGEGIQAGPDSILFARTGLIRPGRAMLVTGRLAHP